MRAENGDWPSEKSPHIKSEPTPIGPKHPDVLELLETRPRLPQLLWMPWWYNTLPPSFFRRRAEKENPPGHSCLTHARLIAAWYGDRKYIDTVLQHVEFEVRPGQETMWIQAYLDVGATLCDLGYSSEGIPYIEKAIALEDRPGFRNNYIAVLCYRLSNEGSNEKVVQLAEAVLTDEPENIIAKLVLERAYINTGRYDQEHTDLTKLVTQDPQSFGFLLAELYFRLKDFKRASDAFDRYEIHRRLHFWLPEYDYKKASAYYHCNQQDKWRDQALRIRRWMKWDKFYRLDAVDKAGIERVPDIDQVIQSDQVDNILFDADKISHYLKTIRNIIRFHIKHHLDHNWYAVPLLVGTAYVSLYFSAKLVRMLLLVL
jgi:tetratricopeptide (TPR) repeat protein